MDICTGASHMAVSAGANRNGQCHLVPPYPQPRSSSWFFLLTVLQKGALELLAFTIWIVTASASTETPQVRSKRLSPHNKRCSDAAPGPARRGYAKHSSISRQGNDSSKISKCGGGGGGGDKQPPKKGKPGPGEKPPPPPPPPKPKEAKPFPGIS